jgi:hypothetical protein
MDRVLPVRAGFGPTMAFRKPARPKAATMGFRPSEPVVARLQGERPLDGPLDPVLFLACADDTDADGVRIDQQR